MIIRQHRIRCLQNSQQGILEHQLVRFLFALIFCQNASKLTGLKKWRDECFFSLHCFLSTDTSSAPCDTRSRIEPRVVTLVSLLLEPGQLPFVLRQSFYIQGVRDRLFHGVLGVPCSSLFTGGIGPSSACL